MVMMVVGEDKSEYLEYELFISTYYVVSWHPPTLQCWVKMNQEWSGEETEQDTTCKQKCKQEETKTISNLKNSSVYQE